MTPGEVERREVLDWIWAKVVEKEMEQDGVVEVVVVESELPCTSVSFPLKDNLRPSPAFMNDSVGRCVPPESVEERGDSLCASSNLG